MDGSQFLTARIRRLLGWQGMLPRGQEELLRLIADAGGNSEPAGILTILPLVFTRQRAVADAAADAVHRLVTRFPDAAAYGGYCESAYHEYRRHLTKAWCDMHREDVRYLQTFGAASDSLIKLASFHPSGYVREEAVKLLDGIRDGSELDILINRVNDWVPQVREAALVIFENRLHPDYATRIVEHLPAIIALCRRTRWSHTELLDRITALLKQPESRDALCAGLCSGSVQVRRFCYGLALDAEGMDQQCVIERALSDPDVATRRWAADQVIGLFAGEELRRMLELLLRSRTASVRRTALYSYVKSFPDKAQAQLDKSLLDPSRSVRDVAQYYVKEHSDPADIYRRLIGCTEGTQLRAAIEGLGETGSKGDASLVLPFTQSPMIGVRRAAVKAVGRLAADEYVDLLFEFLADDRPSISNEARAALTRVGGLSLERLWSLFQEDSRPHVRKNALGLLLSRRGWGVLPYLLRASLDEEDTIASMARDALGIWLHRLSTMYQAPTGGQVAEIRSVLDEYGDRLDRRFVREIEFGLKVLNPSRK